MNDNKPSHRLAGNLIVLLPTVALSAYLGHLHVAFVPRLVLSLGLGMILIAAVAYSRRRGV